MAVLKTLLVCLAAMSVFVELAIAANYTVGGANGWDSSTDQQTWAASQKFAVGDNLIFQYTPNHDVLEVSKADHDSCTTSSPLQTYTDGNTVIPLTAAGKRYFICGTIGHCSQGMKMEVDVLATSTPSAPSPAPKSSSPSASPAPKTSSPEAAPSPVGTPESSAPGTGSPLTPDVPSAESPSVFSPPPSASSADRNCFRTYLTMGFGLVLMLLVAL